MSKENNNNSHSNIFLESSPIVLSFDCPSILDVRVGISALILAITHSSHAAVLDYLTQAKAGLDAPALACAALQRAGVVVQAGQDFGVTGAVNDWLSDASGNFLFDAVRRAQRRAGVDAARQIVSVWRESNRRENVARASAKIDEILSELDKAKTLGSHARVLSEIIGELNSLNRFIESVAVEAGDRLQELENRLQSAQAGARNASPRPAQPQALRWNDFRGHFNNARTRLFGSSQITASQPTAPSGGANALLEREALSELVNVAALEAEQSLVAEIIALLEDEQRADEDTLVLFAEAEAESRREARRMEATRPYGWAGGELLLNGSDLTAAVMTDLFVNEVAENQIEGLATVVLSRFAESHQSAEALGIVASRQTAEVGATVTELLEICRGVIEERMHDFTVADALAVLLRSGEGNWQNKLTTAFRNTTTPNFLAANYERVLDSQIFAAVVYAPAALPERNELVRNALARIRQDIGLNFDIKVDDTAKSRLFFHCEYFCVPLNALRFYEENRESFDSVKSQPRFDPHSLI